MLATYIRKLCLDVPYIRQSGSGNEYYHADALGSILALTNAQGSQAAGYAYQAYGQTEITGSSSNPFQYTGRENDGIGLYNYRKRYYSPVLHRFISEDPSRLKAGLNFYAYASGNPIRFKDPLGLTSIDNRCELMTLEGPVTVRCDDQPPKDDCKLRIDEQCFQTCRGYCDPVAGGAASGVSFVGCNLLCGGRAVATRNPNVFTLCKVGCSEAVGGVGTGSCAVICSAICVRAICK